MRNDVNGKNIVYTSVWLFYTVLGAYGVDVEGFVNKEKK